MKEVVGDVQRGLEPRPRVDEQKELAEWLYKRLEKCLPQDHWQHDQLAALAKDLDEAALAR